MKRSILKVTVATVLTVLNGAEALEWAVCPGTFINAPEKLDFSDQERKFICGTDENENYPWSKVAPSEAQLHLKAFLQQRGYHQVEFERRGLALVAKVATPTVATSVRHEGGPNWLDFTRMRHVEGESLTPKLLDRVTTWATAELKRNGYPCPEARSEADPRTGAITVFIKPGPWQELARVETDVGTELDNSVFRRYDAFLIGDPYNQDYVDLTRDRILGADLVQGSYFVTECTKAGAVLKQTNHYGPPRAVRLGFGVNTEVFLLSRAIWQNSRLGRYGSLLSVEARGSYRQQHLGARLDWYYLPEVPRHHLRTELVVDHRIEETFRRLESKLRFLPSWDVEMTHSRVNLYAGPSVNYSRSFEGPGIDSALFVSAVTGIEWKSHYYELFQGNPRRGYEIRLEGTFANENYLAPVTFQKLEFLLHRHWNLGDLDPPFTVLSVRAGAGLSNAPEAARNEERLPADVFHFLGGSQNLRGFGRNELPGSEGALTTVSSGVESRFVEVLPFHLEPFIFIDVGRTGMNPLTLDPSWYWSPGGGVRWGSPIGPIRATLAHGFFSGEGDPKRRHIQFYISLGEEF